MHKFYGGEYEVFVAPGAFHCSGNFFYCRNKIQSFRTNFNHSRSGGFICVFVVCVVLVLLLGNTGGDIYSVILTVFVVTALALFIGIIWGKGRKKQLLIPTVGIMMICVLSAGFTYCRQRYTDALPKVGSGDPNPHCLSTEFSQSLPPCRS